MKVYTKTGDSGETGLCGGKRVSKDAVRIDAYGTVDELNSSLGVVRSQEVAPECDEMLESIQNELFALGAELATPDSQMIESMLLELGHIERLEREIDRLEEGLEPLREFILPAGHPAAATLHVARGICRRAERRVVTLAAAESLRTEVVQYLNRLGDLLFVMARAANQHAGCDDVPWKKPATD